MKRQELEAFSLTQERQNLKRSEEVREMSKKVLLEVKVMVHWKLLDEFHEYWQTKNLPQWEAHGAKHIGSYVNLVGGGPLNQILRLFEFEDLSKWERFNDWLFGDKFQEATKGRTVPPDELMKYITSVEQKLYVSVY
jgi:hypothetical protein